MTTYASMGFTPYMDPATGEIMDSQREPRLYTYHGWASKAVSGFTFTIAVILIFTRSYQTLAILTGCAVGVMAFKWLTDQALAKWQTRTRTRPPSGASQPAPTTSCPSNTSCPLTGLTTHLQLGT